MKKKTLFLVLFSCLSVFSVFANGQSEKEQPSGAKAHIEIYQSKIEIDQALKEIVAEYAIDHPDVSFSVESRSDNYQTGLRTKFSGGQAPDIFSITGGEELTLWQSRLEDLSDQPWAADLLPLAKSGITGTDGKVYGIPLSIEGYGYVYNKRLFKQAGIENTPKTFTELKEAVEKLKKAGIQPITGAYMDWYQLGMFLVNMGIARQSDPMAFIEGLNKGTSTFVGNKVFEDVANFILYDFSQCKSPMNTGFNQQTSQLMGEEVAMTLGGSWLQPSIDSTNPGMSVGLMPMPINDDRQSNDKLYAGITGYWVISKDSAAKGAAKEFLTWLTTTDKGKKAMTDKLLFIPGFSSFSANQDAIGELGNDLSSYTNQDKLYGIYNYLYPAGGAEAFGNDVQLLVAGKVNVSGFLEQLQKDWDRLKK